MEPSGSTTPVVAPSSAPRRSWLLPVLVVVSVGSALAYRTTHLKTAPPTDPLHGNSEEAPGALLDALNSRPESERLPFLLKSAQDPSAGLRYAAVDALSAYHDAAAIDTVAGAIHDLDSETRKRAVEVLPDMDKERGLRLLLSALHDEDPWIRESAITQISSRVSRKGRVSRKPQLVDGRAVPTLISALDDPDIAVSFTAMTALLKLTGKPWHVSQLAPLAQRQAVIAQWKQWWSEARASWPGAAAYSDVPPSPTTRTAPCPEYYLDGLDGKDVSLHSQEGRLTLLNFWNTQCGPCIVEAPDFVEVDRRYRGRNVDVIGVAVAEHDTKKLKEWCQAHGVTYPQTLSNPQATRAFGDIEDLPVTVLIDDRGRIRNVWQGGPRGPEVYSAAIERVLKERG